MVLPTPMGEEDERGEECGMWARGRGGVLVCYCVGCVEALNTRARAQEARAESCMGAPHCQQWCELTCTFGLTSVYCPACQRATHPKGLAGAMHVDTRCAIAWQTPSMSPESGLCLVAKQTWHPAGCNETGGPQTAV